MRNIAIIAHVDHGKTTLVDVLLRQSGTFRANQQVAERALDSNDLERERGITILAKCTSVEWKGTRINIVDTPGHADFGGEVERILSMVDGVVVLVDAAEGPMPQTKFVLGKALSLGLRPILVINKVDRPDQRAHAVHDESFDLFDALGASPEQLDFPTLFASAKQGWAATEPEGPMDDMAPLFDLIVSHVPAPDVDPNGSFAMLATTLERDPFLGRVLTGRIAAGTVRRNEVITALRCDGTVIEQARLTKLLAFRGLERVPVEEAKAGDIVAVAGLAKATVGDTLGAAGITQALASQPIDPATLAVTFAVNDSPLAGQDGDKVTARQLADRLRQEAEGNVAIQISPAVDKDAFEVAGRGELQLAVLIEQMRREGYEMSVSRPRVVMRTNPDTGVAEEPLEEVVVDVDDAYAGAVVEALGKRRGALIDMRQAGGGKTRVTLRVPSRGLIGYHGQFLTDTRGTGVMNRVFHSYVPHKGGMVTRRTGTLVSLATGKAVAYALWNLEDRGKLMVTAGDAVYAGMIIGENAKAMDLEVNPLKGKQLTNFRASGKDEEVTLTTPIRLTLEQAIAYIETDELIEVTPGSIRLRKRFLDQHERKREARRRAAVETV